MPVRIESHAEPIPGYKLIERLGGGGFGEVWKAEAPGGLLKAIKFVFGDLSALDDEDGSRAKQELKALNRVKTVHHPYILSLECVHIVEGQLIIVMELADRTIYDRFRECHKQGLLGIPRDELLGYMEETAEALDLMNDKYKLQHLDIKPQNLFLVFNHVKVADFGLVKDLEGMQATVTGGVTPVYAAPETFDGWVSRASDQYSLAIVYQELLTGQRPFTGGTIRQLVWQHMQGAPDLSSLMLADRAVVSRALSKNPEHRFPSCLEFVRSLRQVVTPRPVDPPSVVIDQVALPNTELRKIPKVAQEPPLSVTCNARGRLAPCEAVPNKAFPDDMKLPAPPLPMAPLPPRPPRPSPPEKSANAPPERSPDKLPATSPGQPGNACASRALPSESVSISYPAPVSVPFTDSGILRPALIVGLGRVGVDVLRQLRKELAQQYGAPESTPHLRFLAIDTDPEVTQASLRGGKDVLLPSEVALTRLHRPSHYLKPRDGKPPYASWLPSKILYAIPREQNFAGARALGRLALVDNCLSVTQKMTRELETASAPETLQAAAQATGLTPRTRSPRVFIVAGLDGGTGGGMFLDLAYLSRRLLRQQGFKDTEVVGLFCLPPALASDKSAKALVNAHASLAELSYFASRDHVFTARYSQRDGGELSLQDKAPPFQRCVFFGLPEKRGATGRQIASVSQYLCSDLISAAGQEVDRAARRTAESLEAGSINYQTIGMYRLVSPRRAVRRQAAQRVGARLVAHWMNKDSAAMKEATQPWVQEQWEHLGFRPENIIELHHQKCEDILGHKPDSLWLKLIDPLFDDLQTPATAKDDPVLRWTPVVQVVEGLEKLLGVPAEFQGPGGGSSEPAIEKALRQAGVSITAEFEQMLAELIVRLFEEPAFRMAGAEEAIRQFSACIQKTLESQEPLLRELQAQTAALYKHIHLVLESPVQASTPHSRWRAPFTRRPNQDLTHTASELVELVRAYAKSRYHAAVMLSVNSLYVCLRGLLSDQMREISFCRQRLTELADLVGRVIAEDAPCAQRMLLPHGCKTVPEAVAQLDATVGPAELVAFDTQVQDMIQKQYRALVTVCMASTTVIRTLADGLIQHADAFLEERIESADAAALFLSQYADDAEDRSRQSADLLQVYEESAPPLGPDAADNELFVISAPAGKAGDRFRELARTYFPSAMLVTSNQPDEIVFLRQFQSLSLSDFDQFGPVAQDAYRQRLTQDPASVHCRADIEWQTAEPVA